MKCSTMLVDQENLTPRDKKVIKAVGDHKVLAQKQLEKLFFPSYDTCQRRIRKRLKGDGYFSNPYYLWVTDSVRKPIYRLTKKGRKKYKQITGRECRRPTFSENSIPHLYQANRLLIGIYNSIDTFTFEYREQPQDKVQIDILITLQNGIRLAAEVDMSNEHKQEIQKQYRNYERLHLNEDKFDYLVFFSERNNKLYKWCEEIAKTDLEPLFVGQSKESIDNLQQKVRELL